MSESDEGTRGRPASTGGSGRPRNVPAVPHLVGPVTSEAFASNQELDAAARENLRRMREQSARERESETDSERGRWEDLVTAGGSKRIPREELDRMWRDRMKPPEPPEPRYRREGPAESVQLRSGQWSVVDATIDNDTDVAVVEGDPDGIVQLGHAIRDTGWEHIERQFGRREWPPRDAPLTIELSGGEWDYVQAALDEWANIDDQPDAELLRIGALIRGQRMS